VGPNAFEPVSLLLQGGEEAMTVSATGVTIAQVLLMAMD
jgi:hypothetical protein